MHSLTPTILSLAALASALDVRLYNDPNCKGFSTDCPDINPNRCCAGFNSVTRYQSLRFAAVPSTWTLEAKGYNWRNGKYCADLVAVQTMSGATDLCIEGARFGGGGWNFLNRRRGVEVADRECKGSEQASVLTMGNGLRFDVRGMEEGVLEELVGMARNGTGRGDVPVGYGRYEYKA